MLAQFYYNVDGIRTRKVVDGSAINYLVDANQPYAQVIAETDELGQAVKTYLYGHDLISQSSAGQTHSFHYDGLGSTRLLSDAAGNVSDSYSYAAFGELLNSTGDTDNNYLYTGEQYDDSVDNYYLRARYYNPEIGRFTRQDEWLGRDGEPVTLNKYLYANSDGANWIDPSGYMTIGSVMSGVQVRSALQSGATNMAFRVTLKRTANRAMCVFVEEIVEGAVTHGIYVLQDGASHYVGQSNDMDHRIEQHKKNTNKKIRDTLARFDFPFTKNSKRILEQFMMDFVRDVFDKKLTNGRMEIAENPKSSNSHRLRKIMSKLEFCK